jgi:hypothetical protein
MSNIIETYSGKLVDPFNITESDLDIQDIAHGLSNINRFNGHTVYPYSVAEHSVVLSFCFDNDLDALYALMHDADIVSPLKHNFPELIEAEKRIIDLVIKHLMFKNPVNLVDTIKHVTPYDYNIGRWEAKRLKPNSQQGIWDYKIFAKRTDQQTWENIFQNAFQKYNIYLASQPPLATSIKQVFLARYGDLLRKVLNLPIDV